VNNQSISIISISLISRPIHAPTFIYWESMHIIKKKLKWNLIILEYETYKDYLPKAPPIHAPTLYIGDQKYILG
jgi:hypothetical protein